MVRTRAAKVAGIEVPPLEVDDPTGDAEVLVLGWGSTFGPITGAVRKLRADGVTVAQAHLRYLNPMPANIEEVLRRLPPGGAAGDEPRASWRCCCAGCSWST